jgi:NADH-quinone oxidoreductase subunit L
MVIGNALLAWIPLWPLLGFAVVGFLVKRLSHAQATWIACGSVALSFALSVIVAVGQFTGGVPIQQNLYTWIQSGQFNLEFAFTADPLTAVMLLIITGVGLLIHIYSVGYMHGDEGYNKFFAYLNLFIFFMLLLVLGSNYLLMFAGWEGVGLCSYLLIGFWFKHPSYNQAANKAFIMNRIGDLGLILGVMLIAINFGTLDMAIVTNKAASMDTPTLTIITFLLFIGAMGKSAQIPLFTWLPDAMAGPTPVSALIHAATMVTAGIYMIARNNVLYSLSPVTMMLVVIVGLATSIFAASIAITQNDIKKVLAYSTVSQLGLMFVALGVGAFDAGIFHMGTHAFFKALLFLAAGSVIHSLHGEQDIRKMGGLKSSLKLTHATFLIGVLAIAGIPPFAGFFSKDEILAAAFNFSPWIWAGALLASWMTVFYMFRLLFLVFYGEPRQGVTRISHLHDAPRTMAVPLIMLAFFSAVAGFFNLPELLGGSPWLAHQLAPVFELASRMNPHAHGDGMEEFILMAVVLVGSIGLILIAYQRYITRKNIPANDGQIRGLLHEMSYQKYYVDELYETIVVRPLFWVSSTTNRWIEVGGIDTMVNGVGEGVVGAGKLFRWLQSGSIGYYLFIMVGGILAILAAHYWTIIN